MPKGETTTLLASNVCSCIWKVHFSATATSDQTVFFWHVHHLASLWWLSSSCCPESGRIIWRHMRRKMQQKTPIVHPHLTADINHASVFPGSCEKQGGEIINWLGAEVQWVLMGFRHRSTSSTDSPVFATFSSNIQQSLIPNDISFCRVYRLDSKCLMYFKSLLHTCVVIAVFVLWMREMNTPLSLILLSWWQMSSHLSKLHSLGATRRKHLFFTFVWQNWF